jgi:hypothetical protein
MDVAGWLILVGAVVAALVLACLGPWLMRDHRRRQRAGGGASLNGVGGGLDAVWRPSAEDARADWEAQIEVPAPAPDPDEPGRIAGDRLVIDLDTRERRAAS